MTKEGLIVGLLSKEQLIQEIEANMQPGELVMAQSVSDAKACIAKMTASKSDKNLMLAPGPSFIISGSGYLKEPLCWSKEPILLKKYLFPYGDRALIRGIIAVGDESVCEFFAEHCNHHDVLESQKDLLKITNYLRIREGEHLREIQFKVAKSLIEQLTRNAPNEIKAPSTKRRDVHNIGSLLIYTARDAGEEAIQEFVDLMGENIVNNDILRALGDFVDTGLYGLGLEIIIEKKEGGHHLINIDEYFRYLAGYYHPRLTPAEIPRTMWDKD